MKLFNIIFFPLKHCLQFRKLFFTFFLIFTTGNTLIYAETLSVQVSLGNDDAEQNMGDNSMYLNSSDLELAYDGSTKQNIGMRFENVTIPNNATITSAYIQFTVDEADSGSTNLLIYAEDTDDANSFSSSSSDISNRSITSSINWDSVPAWNNAGDAGVDQRTPELKSLVETIINRTNWNSGNAMVFIIKPGSGCDSSTCQRTAESYEGDSDAAPKLVINYTVPQGPPLISTIPDQSTGKDDTFSLNLAAYVTSTNDDPILSYNLLGTLPPGLSFNTSTGLLSGIPTVLGTSTLTLSATDNDGTSSSVSFNINVLDTSSTCSDYDSNNDGCPGTIILSMDQITDSKQRCIVGSSTNGDTYDYYKFTVQAFGALNVSGTSPNGHAYHLFSGSTCGGTDYYPDTATENHTIPTIDLVPGDTVYFAVKETGSDTDEYELTFNFIKDTIFKANDDLYFINKSSELEILKNDNPGLNGIDTSSLAILTGPSNGTITIDNGIVTYVPNNDFSGTDIFTYTVKDNSGNPSNTATVTIKVGTIFQKGDRDFLIRNPEKTRNINGNYAVGGNMNLCEDDGNGVCRDDNSNSNSNDDIYIDIDGDPTTKNSTSFDLDIPSGSKVVWAGLYWQGVVHRSFNTGDFMGDTVPDDAPLLGGDTNQIDLTDNTYGADKVKLKLPGHTDYTTITADTLDYSKLGYGGFTDVTSYLDPANPNGTYVLADIKCHTGAEPNHGNYGGWSLVVIYENPAENFRNISLFDGFSTVDSSYSGNLIIDGFLTPKKAPINSKIAFFTMDGEGGTNSLTVISEVLGTATKVSGPGNPANSLFNSTILGVNNRQPDYPSLRLDLDILSLANILGPLETKATLQPRTTGDRYTASYFIMSSDLISPQLCYDYDLHVGTIKVNSDGNRSIIAETRGGKPLEVKVLIRSMVADFSIENTKAHILFTATPDTPNEDKGFDYRIGESKVSPEGLNLYIPAIETDTSIGQIAIGHNPSLTGGVIDSNESTYFKEYFDFNDTNFEGTFDIVVQGEIDYLQNNNPFIYNLSTKNKSIEKCPTNPVYNPIAGDFNVENALAGASSPVWERYPLYTQVTNRPYEVVLTSYAKDGNGDFTVPLDTNATVEVEIIDASSYDNNASTGYDSTCQEPTAASEGGFIQFHNNSRQNFEPFKLDAYNKTLAMRSAAFRIWILTKEDPDGGNSRLIVHHTCASSKQNLCFETLYGAEDYNQTGLCDTDCKTGVDNISTCYDCLRKYFAIPICSRDNFSIRPESFHIAIGDNNDPADLTNPTEATQWFAENKTSKDTKDLAAGYHYQLDVNATNYPGLDTIAQGYHNDQFIEKTYATLPDIFSGIPLAALSFNSSASCNDTNSSSIALKFYDGKLEITQYLKHNNVGEYKFAISDSEWTEVDQSSYQFKTEFGNGKRDDCDITSYSATSILNDIPGCTIYSVTDPKTEMTLRFRPYQFNLSDILFSTTPNNNGTYLYMNDLSKSLGMAVTLDGNITAEGKDSVALSNFTSTCAAEDINLWIDKNITYQNKLNESTIVDQNGSAVAFQQALNTVLSTDGNLSVLSKTGFLSTGDSNGSAEVHLSYNFAKPYAGLVNPVDVNFSILNAASPDANSYAHKIPDYTPDGHLSVNQSRYFYFAKVAPLDATDNEQVYGPNTTTTLRVQTYCDSPTSLFNCSLLPGMIIDTAPWYLMNGHNPTLDGKVHSLTTTTAAVSIIPNSNITFDTFGATDTITISYPMTGRPVFPLIVIHPDEWLKYNPIASKNGLPEFTIQFLNQGLKWKGKGKTGHVIETEPNVNTNPRMNW